VAVAVWFANQDALDGDVPVEIPGVPAVRNDFAVVPEGAGGGSRFDDHGANIAERADNLFDIENFIARETIGDGGRDSSAPEAAGGTL
jgi:hypothetical protein